MGFETIRLADMETHSHETQADGFACWMWQRLHDGEYSPTIHPVKPEVWITVDEVLGEP